MFEAITARFTYPVTTMIFELRAGNFVLMAKDKARKIVNEDGTSAYYIKGLKKTINSQSFKNIIIGNVLPLFKIDSDTFVPCEIQPFTKKIKVKLRKKDGTYEKDGKGNIKVVEKEIIVPQVKILDNDTRNWLIFAMRRNKNKYDTTPKWQQYLPIISIIMLGIVMIMMIIFFFQGMADASDKVANAAANLIQAANAVNGAGAKPPA